MALVPKEHFIIVVDDLVCQSVVGLDFWNVVFLFHLDVLTYFNLLWQFLLFVHSSSDFWMNGF